MRARPRDGAFTGILSAAAAGGVLWFAVPARTADTNHAISGYRR